MSETSSTQTKRNRKLYCETNQISSSSHVFKFKNFKICGWQSFAFPVSGMLSGAIQLQVVNNTGWKQ